jgi:hypothetical protein
MCVPQVHPEFFAGSEKTGQTQRGIRGNPAFSKDDIVPTCRVDVKTPQAGFLPDEQPSRHFFASGKTSFVLGRILTQF